ncbi:hypothetical protein [Candidatus Cytomitobacter primus]|uniref:Uncharacterized protein n=1 Tax=Candidatus Cytomitobacter primus TaxID=2066024 RepID=A0A5C0UGA1_9PROT|nr:hypothetical protein [Candidatus Cytomitobacter primus]QEK38593.1 hypothetical protein FZC34_01560 [Candidatus Cytomitobacter primus]
MNKNYFAILCVLASCTKIECGLFSKVKKTASSAVNKGINLGKKGIEVGQRGFNYIKDPSNVANIKNAGNQIKSGYHYVKDNKDAAINEYHKAKSEGMNYFNAENMNRLSNAGKQAQEEFNRTKHAGQTLYNAGNTVYGSNGSSSQGRLSQFAGKVSGVAHKGYDLGRRGVSYVSNPDNRNKIINAGKTLQDGYNYANTHKGAIKQEFNTIKNQGTGYLNAQNFNRLQEAGHNAHSKLNDAKAAGQTLYNAGHEAYSR